MFHNTYRYLIILALAIYAYLSTVICNVYYYFKLDIEWYLAFVTILLITTCTWENSRLTQPIFLKRYINKPQRKTKYLVTFFLVNCILSSITTVCIVMLMSMVWHHHTLAETLIPIKLNLIYAWLVNLLFHLVHAINYYFEEYKTKLLEAEELKRISTQAELQLIKSQINPHFLFNNLNVLSALIMKNNTDANTFIEAFSKVYRYILRNHDNELVTMQDEVDFIQPYIYLLEKRFGAGLYIHINIPDKYLQYHLIPASLQMLIENAIKHNIVSKSKPLHIDVHVNGNDTIVVSNNIQLREAVEHSTKIGLNNIDKRYELVVGKKIQVDQHTGDFKVTLPLIFLN